ncbi:MAG TPA: acyltransferase [Telluria sp.]|nr:acyltransferase [Telluria sp.]
MKKEFSIYLDLVRFVAALLVLIHHSNVRSLSSAPIWFSEYGPAAVIIFFVLSGYVISYVASAKEREPIEYWSSRLSRFYSVAIPIVLICPLLDMIGLSLAPEMYVGKTTHDFVLLRMFTSLTFLNEIWTMAIMSFSNVPYWSLNYEIWYYVLFAIVAFMRGRPRAWLAGAVMLFIGPKILLLAPIWILGVFLHRSQRLYRLAPWQYWALFLVSWPLFGLYEHFDLSWKSADLVGSVIGEHWKDQLSFSKFFLADYLLALVIAANFVGFRGIAQHFSAPLLACEKVIRWLAGYTFTLYIMHQPLLLFYGALFRGDPAGKLFYSEVLGATVLTIGLVGAVTEHKRHYLRALIRRQLLALTATKWWRNGITATLSRAQAPGTR